MDIKDDEGTNKFRAKEYDRVAERMERFRGLGVVIVSADQFMGHRGERSRAEVR